MFLTSLQILFGLLSKLYSDESRDFWMVEQWLRS